MNYSDDQIKDLIQSVPKYMYIKVDIINKIKVGFFKPGDKIPTEDELCKQYNCSRLTVRNALTALSNEKYIIKAQGKGTFVNTESSYKQSFEIIKSCTDLIKSQNMLPSKKILFSGLADAPKLIREKLHISDKDPVFVYTRVYFANELPAIYCTSYYNAKFLSGIENIDFQNISIVELLKEKFNLELKRTDRVLSASLAGKDKAIILCTPINCPLLQVSDLKTGIIQNNEEPIEYYTFEYVTDRIKYYPEQQ